MHMKSFTLPMLLLSAGFFGLGCGGSSDGSNAGKDTSTPESLNELIDTTKLKNDLNTVVQSIESGHPDTEKLKEAGHDILNTAATVLSDTAIDKMTGHGGPEGTAGSILKKLRDSVGLSPDKLDSIRYAA